MKKLLFAMIAILSFSTGVFAKESKRKNDENGITKIVNSRKNTAEIDDCRFRGGSCILVIRINGVYRALYVCCGDVRVVVD